MSPENLTLDRRGGVARETAGMESQSVFRVERAPHNSQQRVQDYAHRAAQHSAVDGATRCLPHLLDIRSFPTAEACIQSLKATGCTVWALVRLRPPLFGSPPARPTELSARNGVELRGELSAGGGRCRGEQTKGPTQKWNPGAVACL